MSNAFGSERQTVEPKEEIESRSEPRLSTERAAVSVSSASAAFRDEFEVGTTGSTLRASTRRPLSISRALGRVVVTVHGAVATSDALLVRQVLNDLIDGQGNLDVVVDCRFMTAIDRLGVVVLVEAAQTAAARRGRFALSRPCDEVQQALRDFTPSYVRRIVS